MNFVDGKKDIKVKNKFTMQPIKLSEKKKDKDELDEDEDEIFWHGAYIFWVFKVGKETRPLHRKNVDDLDNNFAIMTKRMYKSFMDDS
jgi:hypothetical protein